MRWELSEDHYLHVEDCEWERTETNDQTGRVARQRLKVPEWLASGTTVCHKGQGERRDKVFFGDPTPAMVPLDDEARELSASFEERWAYKPEGAEVPASQSMFGKMADAMTKPVEVEGLKDLVSTLAATQKTNQELVDSLKLRVKL